MNLITPGRRPEQEQLSEARAEETVEPESKEAVILRRMLREHERDLQARYDMRWYQSWWDGKSSMWCLFNKDKAPGTPGAVAQIASLVRAGVASFEPTARAFARSAATLASDDIAEDLPGSDGIVAVDQDIQEAQRRSILDRIKGRT